jgi:hypothetical protein
MKPIKEAAKTGNEGHGYHGQAYNAASGDNKMAAADKAYSSAHATVKKHAGDHLKDVKNPNKMVTHYLDSKLGRHLHGNEHDADYVKKDFGRFKKTYKPEMHEEIEIVEDSSFKDALPHIIKDIKAKKSAQELRQTHGTHYKRVANAASNVHGPKYTRSHLLSVAQNAMNEEVDQNDKPPFAGPYDKKEDQKAKDKNVAKNAARKSMKQMTKEEIDQILEAAATPLNRVYLRQTTARHKSVHGVDANGKVKTLSGPTNFMDAASIAAKHAKKHGLVKHDDEYKKSTSEEVIDEVLTKSTSAGETIDDFVHSKNKMFSGDSKKQRIKRALGAYYSKQNEEAGESEEISEVNHRDYGAKGKMHPDIAKNMKVGQHVDFYSHGTGDKQYGMVTKNTGTAVHIKADKKTHKFSVTPHLGEDLAVPLLGGDQPRGDSDEAIEMVKSELKALANKAMHLMMNMPEGMHVEPWVQAKIAQAKSYVSDVHDYCIYGDHDKPEEDEQMDTPMTFPNMSVDVNTGRNV